MHPILEYASSVWDPHGIVLQEELEKVQNLAARFVTGNYNFETGSMSSILEQLGWCKGSKLILLVKGLKGRASIQCDDLQSPNRHIRNQHPMAFQVPYSRTDIYKYSFFPDTVRDWNVLPTYIISSAESSEDPVVRITSLVRSRVFAIVKLGERMSIDVSPVKYSDSESLLHETKKQNQNTEVLHS